MGLRLCWGGGGERVPWLGSGRVGAPVTAASGCAIPGQHGLGAQHQLPPARMWLGAAQEQTSQGQHPQRARLCPRPGATSSSWLGVWCPRMSPGLAARALCWQHGGLLPHVLSLVGSEVPRRWAGLWQCQRSAVCRRCWITARGLPAGLPVPVLLLTC